MPKVCPTSSCCELNPSFCAGFAKPTIPIVVLIKKLAVALPAAEIFPWRIWLGIDSKVAMFEVKFPVPFFIGSGNLLYPFAIGFYTTLSKAILNLNTALLGPSKHSLDAWSWLFNKKINEIKIIMCLLSFI